MVLAGTVLRVTALLRAQIALRPCMVSELNTRKLGHTMVDTTQSKRSVLKEEATIHKECGVDGVVAVEEGELLRRRWRWQWRRRPWLRR